jgi:tripartite ATP-independent transporter DctM subunit
MVPTISAIFFLAVMLGMPIAFGMGIAGAIWILFFEGLEPGLLARRMANAMQTFAFVSIPLFVVIGYLAERAGLLPDLVRWLQMLLGRMKGGMAYINVVNSMLFAGISGTAVSDVASLGRIEIRLMEEAGYSRAHGAALTAATSICGPIIPPSVAMIIYALAAGNVSIGGLFLAGAIPGFLLGAGMLVMSWWHARKGRYGLLLDRPPLRDLVWQTARVVPLLVLPLIILGGIISGVFTVTESATIGVLYVMIVGFFYTRRLSLRDVYDAIVYSAVISSVLGMLIGSGVIIGWILTRNQVSQQLADWVMSLSADPIVFMLLVAGVLFFLGMVMDATAIIIMLTPLLAPIAAKFGIPDLQFGPVFVLTCMLGLITPPVGVILFMVCAIAELPLQVLSREVIPYVIWILMVIVLMIFFPSLTLFLPSLLGF